MSQSGLFGEDLIWRYPIFVKFGENSIWRRRKFSLNFTNLTSEIFPEIRKSLIQIKQRKHVFAETFAFRPNPPSRKNETEENTVMTIDYELFL